jgi:SAM-dependent methyltransferase
MNPNKTVVHTPSYILRRRIILHLLRRYEPGRFLEIGCGRGDLLPHLVRLGFEGVGLEISPEVLPLAREAIRPYDHKLSIVAHEELLKTQHFGYVFAFEVLEHIRDDAAALVNWRKWLAPEGRLVITVPAHMKSWTASDDVVGHYRRYERDGLCRLLEGCGYMVDVFWSYGFPLTTLTRGVRPFICRSRSKAFHAKSKQDRTLHSALESRLDLSRLGRRAHCMSPVMEGIGFTFHLSQLLFRGLDIGDGYIVGCRIAQH